MLVLRAPAKINLTLEVLARRAGGLHGIRSVMVPLELADELIVEERDRFAFACDRPDLDCEDNLVVRALRALGSLPPRRFELHKRIPVQAGLGGGSSDAGAVLRGAMSGAFGAPAADWLSVARSLGSDVPFFLAGTAALVEGTGERVTPLGAMPRWHVLIVKPPASVSTTDAYAQLDRTSRPARARRTSVSLKAVTALQRGDFESVRALLSNDFQAPIASSVPAVATALDALRSAGACNPLLAGSGSCVFALVDKASDVTTLVHRLSLPPEYVRIPTAFAATEGWRA